MNCDQVARGAGLGRMRPSLFQLEVRCTPRTLPPLRPQTENEKIDSGSAATLLSNYACISSDAAQPMVDGT